MDVRVIVDEESESGNRKKTERMEDECAFGGSINDRCVKGTTERHKWEREKGRGTLV